MDRSQLNYAAARDHMVDSQLRPNRIVDPRLIRAMRTVPRELFVPEGLAALAYVDEDLALGNGRWLVEPLVVARLIQLARVRDGESALVVGAGAGYGAAVLASCGASVTALEHDEALLERARAVLHSVAPAVQIKAGSLAEGLPGPWDVVLIEGAVRAIPPALAELVDRQHGRLVTVVASSPGLGKGMLAEPVNPGAPETMLRAQPFFDCATPYLPELLPKPSFQF